MLCYILSYYIIIYFGLLYFIVLCCTALYCFVYFFSLLMFYPVILFYYTIVFYHFVFCVHKRTNIYNLCTTTSSQSKTLSESPQSVSDPAGSLLNDGLVQLRGGT